MLRCQPFCFAASPAPFALPPRLPLTSCLLILSADPLELGVWKQTSWSGPSASIFYDDGELLPGQALGPRWAWLRQLTGPAEPSFPWARCLEHKLGVLLCLVFPGSGLSNTNSFHQVHLLPKAEAALLPTAPTLRFEIVRISSMRIRSPPFSCVPFRCWHSFCIKAHTEKVVIENWGTDTDGWTLGDWAKLLRKHRSALKCARIKMTWAKWLEAKWLWNVEMTERSNRRTIRRSNIRTFESSNFRTLERPRVRTIFPKKAPRLGVLRN